MRSHNHWVTQQVRNIEEYLYWDCLDLVILLIPTVPNSHFSLIAGSKIKEIANVPEWEAFVSGSKSSGRPFIVEFTAAWCPPCKMIAPVLEELAAKHTDVDFVKVDIDNQDVTPVVVENNVSAVPTFVSMRGEKKLTTFSGADKGQLLRMVQEVSEL